MGDIELRKLLEHLISQKENEYIEFKHNFHEAKELGKDISALSNSASDKDQEHAYLVFGIEDGTNKVLGTNFYAKSYKVGNEELSFWLTKHLDPKTEFEVFEFGYDDKHISLYRISACQNIPIKFDNIAYIRIGSNTTKLSDYPEKERKIWNKEITPFEEKICKSDLSSTEIANLLNIETYYKLINQPALKNIDATIKKFEDELFIIKKGSTYSITMLGALLLAKNINSFNGFKRRAVRVITYKGLNKVDTIREQISSSGYAVDFIKIIDWINSQLPANEEIGKALRKETTMYPQIAIRELVANAILHQDFSENDFIMVEIFDDRVEITNPGLPLIEPDRFINDYKPRNKQLADVMRRMGLCEEKGSGFYRVVFNIELFQLPPIDIRVDTDTNKTKIIIYSYKALKQLDKTERIKACYQHACLKYVSPGKMTNQSLRDRFKIEEHKSSVASKIIQDTLAAGRIKLSSENGNIKSKKFASYLPYWA